MGFMFENGCFWVDKTILVMFTEYYSRRYALEPKTDADRTSEMIYVNEYSPVALYCFLNYVYTGKIFNKILGKVDLYDIIEVLVELCHMAADFREETLREALVALLTKNEFGIIKPKLAFFIAQLAQKFGVIELLHGCVDYMNFDWEKNPEFLQKIVKMKDENEILAYMKKNLVIT